MKPSEQWMCFAKHLDARATKMKELAQDKPSMLAVAIALVGASADAASVAAELEKLGE